MAQLPWHTSVSILVAGGLVAGAVYLALRPSTSSEPAGSATERTVRPAPSRSDATSPMAERDRRRRWEALGEPERDDAPAPAPPGDPEPPRDEDRVSEAEQAMAVAPPLLGMPAVPRALSERVERDAREAFEGIRGRVRADCWDARPDEPEASDAVGVVLSLSYDAEGTVLASGITEDREHSREGLADCLRPLVHELDVPAPGSHLSIELRVEIP